MACCGGTGANTRQAKGSPWHPMQCNVSPGSFTHQHRVPQALPVGTVVQQGLRQASRLFRSEVLQQRPRGLGRHRCKGVWEARAAG